MKKTFHIKQNYDTLHAIL